jgi:ADP-ribosylglycohydrolase
MIGAIVGDIIGSVYERRNIKTKDFPLFCDDRFFTDDTVMTIAVAKALMDGGEEDDFINAMRHLGRLYPDAGYGGRFTSGCTQAVASPPIAGETVRRCGCLRSGS